MARSLRFPHRKTGHRTLVPRSLATLSQLVRHSSSLARRKLLLDSSSLDSHLITVVRPPLASPFRYCLTGHRTLVPRSLATLGQLVRHSSSLARRKLLLDSSSLDSHLTTVVGSTPRYPFSYPTGTSSALRAKLYQKLYLLGRHLVPTR